MKCNEKKHLKGILGATVKPILPIAKRVSVEVWKEITPGLYVNKVNGHKLSANDFDIYRTHIEWAGVSIIVEKF